MKSLNLILLFVFASAFSSFSQIEEKIDSTKIETKCECLEAEYLFKKDFLENLSISNGEINLSPEFVKKYNFSSEKLIEMSDKCDQVILQNQDEPCPYSQKLAELAEDFELVLRVIKMKSNPENK